MEEGGVFLGATMVAFASQYKTGPAIEWEAAVAIAILVALFWIHFRSSLFPCLLTVSLSLRFGTSETWIAILCAILFMIHTKSSCALAWVLSLQSPVSFCYMCVLETVTHAPLFQGAFVEGERHVVSCLVLGLIRIVYWWPADDTSLTAIPVLILLTFGSGLSLTTRKLSVSLFLFLTICCVGLSVMCVHFLTGLNMIDWALAQLWKYHNAALSSLVLLSCGLGVIVAWSLYFRNIKPGFAHRKLFHALIVGIFASAMVSYQSAHWIPALVLASMAAMCALLWVELFRAFVDRNNNAAQWINYWYGRWIDNRDSGALMATTHLQLLLGCAIPIIMSRGDVPRAVCGVVVIGVGDSMAAIIGSQIGRTRWARNNRTMEGSLAMLFSTILAFFALAPTLDALSVLRVSVSVAIMEAVTVHTDNLMLPLFAISII
jgi:dolichol kinase